MKHTMIGYLIPGYEHKSALFLSLPTFGEVKPSWPVTAALEWLTVCRANHVAVTVYPLPCQLAPNTTDRLARHCPDMANRH